MGDFGALILGHIPALLMMIAGFVLLVVEMYIPGFGLAGISGTVLMVGGILLTGGTPAQMLVLALISVVLLGAAFSIAMHSLSKGRLSRSKLILNEVLGTKDNAKDATYAEEDLKYFVGHNGTAHTALRPAGIAEFSGVKLNVVSDGEFVDAGTPVYVKRVDGNRIIVTAGQSDRQPQA